MLVSIASETWNFTLNVWRGAYGYLLMNALTIAVLRNCVNFICFHFAVDCSSQSQCHQIKKTHPKQSVSHINLNKREIEWQRWQVQENKVLTKNSRNWIVRLSTINDAHGSIHTFSSVEKFRNRRKSNLDVTET